MPATRSKSGRPVIAVRSALCGGFLILGLAAMPVAAAQVAAPSAVALPAIAVQVAVATPSPAPPVDPLFYVVVAPGVIPAPLVDETVTQQLAADAPEAASSAEPVDLVAEPPAQPTPSVPVGVRAPAGDQLADTGFAFWPVAIAATALLCGGRLASPVVKQR